MEFKEISSENTGGMKQPEAPAAAQAQPQELTYVLEMARAIGARDSSRQENNLITEDLWAPQGSQSPVPLK